MDNRLGYAAIARKRKKRRRRMAFTLCVVIITAFVMAVLIHKRDSILAPLSDAVDDLRRSYTTSGSEGFPMKLPVSATYSFTDIGDEFCLLTDTYLYMFLPSGRQQSANQNAYGTPVAVSNGKRVLLYDKNAYEFSLYGKNGLLYKKNVSESETRSAAALDTVKGNKIMYASLGAKDMAAVVTSSAKYANVLDIYDKNGDFVCKKRFQNENVMQAEFTSDGKYVFAVTLGFENGDVAAYLYYFDPASPDDYIWKNVIGANIIPFGLYTYKNSVSLICDKGVFRFSDSGKAEGSYSWTGNVIKFDFGGYNTVVMLSDYVTGKLTAVCLNETCEVVSSRLMEERFADVMIDGSDIYCIEDSDFVRYDKTFKELLRVSLEEEYSDFVKINNDIFLLGYSTVEKISLSN